MYTTQKRSDRFMRLGFGGNRGSQGVEGIQLISHSRRAGLDSIQKRLVLRGDRTTRTLEGGDLVVKVSNIPLEIGNSGVHPVLKGGLGGGEG